MHNRALHILVTVFLALQCVSTFCFADTLVLKDGTVINGTIAEEAPEYVVVDSEGMSSKYFSEEIEKIDKDVVLTSEKSAIKSELAFAHFKKAKDFRKENKYEDAIAELKKAIEIDPANSIYSNHIAELYYNLGQYDQALKYGQETLSLNPNNKYILACMALAYYQIGEYKKGRETFRKFRKSFQRKELSDERYFDRVEKKVKLLERLVENKDTPDREYIKEATSQF
ncbi:MAG: tetratricopeptide repeat protein [Candidatus Omnitrophica bacterium]|nr:tetratricopeptide repeat protein [Candidatus Omnitrophota bacterium]MDD5518431.1 tetratricopeptide repeat protein [Candidatus Omnitrophota bacterium]